jgi:hypothetical protein
MAESEANAALEAIYRQLTRIHRRRNVYELQGATCLLVASVATGAAVLVVSALTATAGRFALIAWGVVGALGVATVLVGLRAGRRWVPRRCVAAWADRAADLRGRLATLVEVWAPDRSDFFLPLLLEENRRWLPAWTPPRLVPHRVPRRPLAAAAAGLAALGLAVALAPSLRPAAPDRIAGDDRPALDLPNGPAEVDRLPAGALFAGQASGDGAGAASPAEDKARSALAWLPAALQDALRRQAWGPGWEGGREEATDRGGAPPGAQLARGWRPAESGDREDGSSGEDGTESGLPLQQSGRKGSIGADGRTPGGQLVSPESASTARADAAPREFAEGTDGTEGDAAGPGAGTATDPNLFGASSVSRVDAGDTFQLGLAAPLQVHRGTPRGPGDAVPMPEPEGQPRLAARERPEAAMAKMAVPAPYEAIVRALFAHPAESTSER